MNPLKSSAGFLLPAPTPRPKPAVWPMYVCMAGCVLAACITLNPSANRLWSQSTSPALAAVDRVIAPLGVSINQHLTPSTPSVRPVIAIIFGCIQPDETVDEPTRAERLAEHGETPEVGDLKTITQPVHWRRPLGETSYQLDTESFRD
jgi:hypothetical protein